MNVPISGSGNPASVKVSHEDLKWMARALRLAQRGRYTAHPNPCVGAILVKDGHCVGSGYHRVFGEAHAEIEALRVAGNAARGAICYVTLEPCCHEGKTPPCTRALINAKVARVIYGARDPNPRVDGHGAKALQDAGIAVHGGILEDEARAQNRGFFKRMNQGAPWVTVKLAMSLDGRTAMASGESRYITSSAARADVQRLRARSCAILTGIGTVLADDPALNVRDESLDLNGRQPLRAILDTKLEFPPQAQMLRLPGKTIIYTGILDEATMAPLRELGAEVVSVPHHEARLDIDTVLRDLARREVNEVLVEAGAVLAGSVVAQALCDELIIYLAPKLLGDQALGLVSLPGLTALGDAIALSIDEVRMVGPDLRLRAHLSAA